MPNKQPDQQHHQSKDSESTPTVDLVLIPKATNKVRVIADQSKLLEVEFDIVDKSGEEPVVLVTKKVGIPFEQARDKEYVVSELKRHLAVFKAELFTRIQNAEKEAEERGVNSTIEHITGGVVA